MLKLGFFTDNTQLAELVGDLGRQAYIEVEGIWAEPLLNGDDKRNFSNCFSDPEKLYGSIDVGVISISSSELFMDIVTAAIKNGVHPLVVGLPDLQLSTYNQLSLLSAEMGVELGFSHIYHRFSGFNYPLVSPIIAHLTRGITMNQLNQFEMAATLRFDIATILSLTTSEVRRIRTYVLPQSGECPSCMMVFIDFFNNSAITYNLTLGAKRNFLELRLNSIGEAIELYEDEIKLATSSLGGMISTSIFLDDLNNFTGCIGIQREPLLGISFVMKILSAVEAISQKMAR
ncbi:MAG TPA: hypothetical protein PLH74_05035 [Tenuifilaceae bacterium]|nr:hypothetical protein [Tenuifilaceae bacterium]